MNNTPTIEETYTSNESLEHRKKFAQFFTPEEIAKIMCLWLLKNISLKNVLEPAFGLGVFTRQILAMKNDVKVDGFDIDPVIIEYANKLFSGNENVSIFNQDYMYNGWENNYDGIICNPPYLKFHDYQNKNAINELKRKLNCDLTNFSNLYTLFLLKSLTQLNNNGRCAFIIPLEFLNSDYGIKIKEQLLHTGTLRHIIILDHKANLFKDVITTSCIVLCENNATTSKVMFSYIKNAEDLQKLQSATGFDVCDFSYESKELDPKAKWKKYYQPQIIRFKELVPFSKYAKVMRGIATGDNDYFTFTRCKAEKYNISMNYLMPCICHSIDVKKTFFTTEEYHALINQDKKAFILNAVVGQDINVENYIRFGVDTGVNERYLTSKRNPWFALEKRVPSPIWVSVFNRTGFRFIRNLANVSNLTTFHCIYPTMNADNQISLDLLHAYLITRTAAAIFEMNAREYGKGLKKFEPNDLNHGLMIDIDKLDTKEKQSILKLYNQYRTDEDNRYIEAIDTILINKFQIKECLHFTEEGINNQNR